MAYRSNDLLDSGTSATAGASALFRVIGGWGNTAGPSNFMLKAIIIGSSSAVFYGLTGGMIGSYLFGTAALPFIIMSSLGFTLGMARWYGVAVRQALMAMERFPKLIRLHMDVNYPSERFRERGLEWFATEEFRRSWRMQSMLVTGWLTAQEAIEEITAAEEAALVAEASQAALAKEAEEQ